MTPVVHGSDKKDPIHEAMQCRQGKNDAIAEVEARKMKITIPKQFKLVAKKDETFLVDSMPKQQASKEALKPKDESKLKNVKAEDDKKFKPNPNDIIEVAVCARKENKNEPLSEMEAKK